jgi:hypothetical protein
VLGQAINLGASTNPVDPLNCADPSDPGFVSQPLHPFAGVPYNYVMTNGAGEVSKNWTWWATKNPEFIKITPPATTPDFNLATQLTVTANDLVATSASPVYGVDNRGGALGANTVSITWSALTLASTEYQGDVTAAGTPSDPSPTFVVGYSEGLNCADNIEVFEINPMPNFTIDIASIDTSLATPTLAWDAPAEQCVDVIQSATYNNANKELTMDYGKNNFYFEIAAANFNTSWNPVFTIVSGLELGQQAIITLYPTYAAATAGGATTITGGTSPVLTAANLGVGNGWDPDINFDATVPANSVNGVSVFARVTVYNGTWESLDVNPFVLAVDAQDFNGAGIWDMEDDDCSALTDAADQIDQATHNINPRPTLEMNGGAMNEGNGTDPDDVINKTQIPKP